MKTIRIDVTTDGDGNGSGYGTIAGGGLLYAVQCIDGTFADGVDLDLTDEQGDLSRVLFSVDNFNTDIIYYPRVLENLNTDGTALTTHTYPLATGRIKATVASGGAVAAGGFLLYFVEL